MEELRNTLQKLFIEIRVKSGAILPYPADIKTISNVIGKEKVKEMDIIYSSQANYKEKEDIESAISSLRKILSSMPPITKAE